LFIPEKLHDPALAKVVPDALLDWYRTEPAQAFKRELAQEDFGGGTDREIADVTRNPIGRGERSLRYLVDIGHPLLLASDHPAHPGHANHPGLSSYQELVHMARLGIGLQRLFEAATINNAETFGLADRYGSVEVGKTANLLLLEANPLQTVEAYNSIRWIVLGGRLIARETLPAETVR
jgi:imidazolonepropionase-like amidohydrolase